MKALRNRLIIQLDERPEITQGGIHIPETAYKEKPIKATIISVGPTVEEKCLVEGGRVLVGKFAGSDLTIDEIPYIVVREDEILAVMK